MKYLDDVLVIAGVSISAVGVFLIYIPAGFIFAGFSLIGIAYFLARGGN